MRMSIEIECQAEEELFHVNYDLRRYSETARRLEECIHAHLDPAGVPHEVLVNPGPGEGWEAFTFGARRRGCIQSWYVRADNQYRRIRYPRLGAVEVSLRCPKGSAQRCQLPARLAVWSKLKQKRWPDPEELAGRVAQLLTGGQESRDADGTARPPRAPTGRRSSAGPARPQQQSAPRPGERPASAPQRPLGNRGGPYLVAGAASLPARGPVRRGRPGSAPFEEADPSWSATQRPAWCAGGGASAVRLRQASRDASLAHEDEEEDGRGEGGAAVALAAPQAKASPCRWLADLAEVSEGDHLWPLLHRAIGAGRTELMRRLLMRRLLNAMATAGRWDAAAELLKEGCRADGRNGTLALAAMQRAAREGSAEEADRARELLDVLYERQQRPPAATLAEFFRRQVRGEVTHGIEPRRYELRGEELHFKAGSLRVWARVLVVESWAEEHDVLFIALSSEDYVPGDMQAETLDLGGRRLLREEHLLRDSVLFAAPVAVPPARLAPAGRDGTQAVKAEAAGRLVSKLPVVARTPPCGSLCVSGTAACCGVPVGRIELVVNGTRVGETPELGPGSEQASELKVSLPLKELDVALELSGQRLKQERLLCGPGTELLAEVPVSIFVYVQPIEGEDLDFVFVCGHRRDVPLEDGARAFVGEAKWDNGCVRLATLEPLVLGPTGCLDRLKSLVLRPDLPAGRSYEMVEWEDTGVCQFQRCIVNLVRVGKIFSG